MSDKDKVYENLRKKGKIFFQVFSSPQGTEALKALEAEFDGDNIRADNPYDTYYNLGRRDVVVYIRQLLRYMEKQDE